MNERIKELLTQSGYDARYCSEDFDPAKFAELIVRECAEVAHCNFHVDGVTLGNIMKERFGVEE
jgi:hypothetical protein